MQRNAQPFIQEAHLLKTRAQSFVVEFNSFEDFSVRQEFDHCAGNLDRVTLG